MMDPHALSGRADYQDDEAPGQSSRADNPMQLNRSLNSLQNLFSRSAAAGDHEAGHESQASSPSKPHAKELWQKNFKKLRGALAVRMSAAATAGGERISSTNLLPSADTMPSLEA